MSATSSRLRTAPTAWLLSESPLCSGVSSSALAPSKSLEGSHGAQDAAATAKTAATPTRGVALTADATPNTSHPP